MVQPMGLPAVVTSKLCRWFFFWGAVVVVGHHVEAIEPQKLRLPAVDLGHHLDADALVGVARPDLAAVDVTVVKGELHRAGVYPGVSDLHGPLLRSVLPGIIVSIVIIGLEGGFRKRGAG